MAYLLISVFPGNSIAKSEEEILTKLEYLAETLVVALSYCWAAIQVVLNKRMGIVTGTSKVAICITIISEFLSSTSFANFLLLISSI